MTDEKKARIGELRRALAALPEDKRTELAEKIGVVTVEGRTLSLKNRLLLAIQCPQATIVGGYVQFKRAGRQVKHGEHGHLIWFPAGARDENGNVTDAENFYTTSVFDITQTEPAVPPAE